ncbi:MAG: SDR family oxidoreductase [Lewinellaceae bacterium]|nr:SDR family oxidoreductase [Lewinellaceae bacterium]
MNIVVSGATKGIGRAIADEFAARGFDVAVCARREADLQEMQEVYAHKFPGCRLLVHPADLQKKEDAQAFAHTVLDQWEHVDVLVNNAGLFLPGAIHEEPDGRLEEMVQVNLFSAYYLTRAFLPAMLQQGRGHIFNMCSIASLNAYPNGGSYSISKFALQGFSKNLREELKDKGIRVTSIHPGATWSASWAGAPFPEDRLMQAGDIAIAVWSAWSMSPAAVVEDIIVRPQLGDLP